MRESRGAEFGSFLESLEERYGGGGGGKKKGKKREPGFDDISEEDFNKARDRAMGKKVKGK